MYYIAVCDDDKRIGGYIENIVTVQDGFAGQEDAPF